MFVILQAPEVARQVVRIGRGEKHGQRGNRIGISKTLLFLVRQKMEVELVTQRFGPHAANLFLHGGVHDARVKGVDLDVVRFQLLGKRSGELNDPRLGDRIGAESGK